MEGTPQPFNVRAIYALKVDVHYRVYPRGDTLYLVRIGGQRVGGYTTGLRIGFGLIGALIGELIQKKVDQSQANRVWELDSRDPEQMVQTEKGSSVVRVSEVISSSIEPAATFGGHGAHHGKWILRKRGEQPVTFQFETLQDMQVGVHALQATLGRRISVNVVWDNQRSRFDKVTK